MIARNLKRKNSFVPKTRKFEVPTQEADECQNDPRSVGFVRKEKDKRGVNTAFTPTRSQNIGCISDSDKSERAGAKWQTFGCKCRIQHWQTFHASQDCEPHFHNHPPPPPPPPLILVLPQVLPSFSLPLQAPPATTAYQFSNSRSSLPP